MPLTTYEIQQALTVAPHNSGEGFRLRAPFSIVRLCSPIVEVVDDYAHFVHFTVQEYAQLCP